MLNFDKKIKEELIISEAPIIFLLGLRRSGTTICLKIFDKGGFDTVFEPRDLWWSITQGHLARFNTSPAHVESIKIYQHLFKEGTAIKFAFEPGMFAFYWVWIHYRFPNAKFVFILRNCRDTYSSYYKMDKDSVQGALSYDIFQRFHQLLCRSYMDYITNFGWDKGAIIDYDRLVIDKYLPDMVHKLTGIPKLDLVDYVRFPNHRKGIVDVC